MGGKEKMCDVSKRAMGMYMASNDEGSVSFLLHSHPDLSTLSSNQPLHQHLFPLPSPGKVHHPHPHTPLLIPPTTSTRASRARRGEGGAQECIVSMRVCGEIGRERRNIIVAFGL